MNTMVRAGVVALIAGGCAASAGAQTLYITSFLNSYVRSVDTSSGVTTQIAAIPGAVQGVFDDSGNFYVVQGFGAGIVSRITPGGVVSSFISTPNASYSGLARDASGNLYVADQVAETVTKFSSSGSVLQTIPMPRPFSLRFGPDGFLYVVQGAINQISRISPSGAVSFFMSTPLTPNYIAFDSSGRLYGSALGIEGIFRRELNGSITTFASMNMIPTLNEYFSGIAFGPGGVLYGAQSETGKIFAISPAGVFTQIASGLDFGNDVVLRPVLTPACYANCDGSTAVPVLNALDFSCFLTRYQAGDSYANCDGSTAIPVLNALDFSCFLTRYVAGCP